MILFCDFNPKLTRQYYTEEFYKNRKNKAEDLRVYPSGNGIDMAVFAKNLSEEGEVFLLEGLSIGREITTSLKELGIHCHRVKLKDDNVEHLVVKQNRQKTEVMTPEPRITMEDRNDILAAFYEACSDKKIVIVAEIDNESLSPDLYEKLIHHCYQKNIKIGVTVSDLFDIKSAKPYLLVIEKDQLEKDKPIYYTSEVLQKGRLLIDKGVGILFVLSQKGAIIMTKDKNYHGYFTEQKDRIEKVNKNLMLTGLSIGIERDYNFETSIKLGLACSIWENFNKFRQVEMSEIKKWMNTIVVEEI
ncbi:MAG: hypothetical protein Q4P25_01170 [Tissierellia bacterium]|nr:hypothetical protein [Tissierellia bacterium]